MDNKPRVPWTKREGKRWLYESGLLLSCVSAFFFVIGFSTPKWIVSWPRVYSGFKSVGLHEICLAGLVLPADPSQTAYHGCWWIFSDNLNDIQPWIWPAWFAFTIAAMCFCFIFEGVSLIILLLLWYKTGRFQRKIENKKQGSLCLLQTAAGFTVASAVVEGVTLLVFAIMFYRDRNWLPNPFFNYLSYSYGLTLVSCFFSIFASIAQVTYVLIVRQEMREPPRQVNLSGYMPPIDKSMSGSRAYMDKSMSGSRAYMDKSMSGSRAYMDKSMSGSKPNLPQNPHYDPRLP